MSQIQYIIDDKNIVTGVIVPIELWRKIQTQNKKVRMMKNRREKGEKEIEKKQTDDMGFFRGIDKI